MVVPAVQCRAVDAADGRQRDVLVYGDGAACGVVGGVVVHIVQDGLKLVDPLRGEVKRVCDKQGVGGVARQEFLAKPPEQLVRGAAYVHAEIAAYGSLGGDEVLDDHPYREVLQAAG